MKQIPWARLFVLLVGCRLVLTVAVMIGISAGVVTPNGAQYRGTDPYGMWFLWDTYWYEKMAVRDWLEPLSASAQAFVDQAASDPTFSLGAPDELHRFAFAPLFPLLAKPLAVITGRPDLALLLVSQAAAYGCAVMGWLLGRLHFGRKYAFATAVAVMTLPLAFLLQAPMTEPLFTFLVMATIWAALTKRWGWAAVFAFALGLTRSTGFMVAIPLGVIAWHAEGWRLVGRAVWARYLKALPAMLAGPAAWALFCVWCKAMTGDFLAYNHIQRAGWGVQTGPPWWPIIDALTTETRPNKWMLLVIVALILFASIAAAVWVKQPGYGVLALVLMLLPLMMGDRWEWSILRYLTPVFPAALAGVAVWRINRGLGVVLVGCSAMLQITLCLLWQTPGLYVLV